MFNKKIILFILFSIILFTGCLNQSTNNTRQKQQTSGSTSGESNTNTTTSAPNYPNFQSGEGLYWYSGQKVIGTITVNQDIQTVVYLRGERIHSFLSSDSVFNYQYCLVIDYNTIDVVKQLRVRAIPITFNNFITKSVERLFRIDLPEKSLNQDTCYGTVDTISGPSNDVAFAPADICNTCHSTISSTSVRIFSASSTGISNLSLVPQTSLDISPLGFRVNVESAATSPVSTCTNSSCQAQGFDCCQDGQCIKDGTLKPNASSDPNYQQAINDVASNPLNFVNWPSIYFVCNNNIYPTPTATPTVDPSESADAALAQAIKDYYCLEGAIQTTPDYSQCSPSADYNSYIAVRNNVWDQCGCEADPNADPPLNSEIVCPDFGLQVIQDNNNQITQVICKIPDPAKEPTPFQNLEISLPSKTAPHRFFRATDGTSVDDLSTLSEEERLAEAEGTPVAEGEDFSYLDENGKSGPQNGEFNMNSITGQMSVALDQTLPAKTINLDFDQTYIISTISGYYTPCPQCVRDSWFSTFTSSPPSQGGMGLRSVGFSTSRDLYYDNITNGNYEDTIFGRACWLPPTMIPFSHYKSSNIQTQRGSRLATQAAYYVNGYQRDWFGFNKGSVIGSFDGVKWFAIGNGRRVTATSNKLFLAINDSFLDLNEISNMVVSITLDLGNNVAASYDYDPSLTLTDARQNQAGNCQFFHQCSTDADCITKLGWEYFCADISNYRTNWPKFNIDAQEIENEQLTGATFSMILQEFLPPGSTRRCVYRGAGAPCKRDFTEGGLSIAQKKLLTCAPNFYCAELTDSSYNKEVVRTPNGLENILYGQEADILGRPLNYINANGTLDTAIIDNIKQNAANYTTSTDNFGICRPGKILSKKSYLEQHQDSDSSFRTDYISQISSCDSSYTSGDERVYTCPLIDDDPDSDNYLNYIITEVIPTDFTIYHKQNMCGRDAMYDNGTADSGDDISPFSVIEANSLVNLSHILSPTVAQDACLRRAGSVCHTNLDCGPNKLHNEQTQYYNQTYFGDTMAEYQYWQENLVCSQSTALPQLHTTDYYKYDLTQNRCCRAIGEELTLYTQGDQDIITDIHEDGDNSKLVVNRFPKDGTNQEGRYSRYTLVAPLSTPIASTATPFYAIPKVDIDTTPGQFQWRTIHDTAQKTCCGGGWIRKFADNTNDWSNTHRLSLFFDKFECLNYQSELHNLYDSYSSTDQLIHTSKANYEQGLEKLCLSPNENGCVQAAIPSVKEFEITYPEELDATTTAIASIDTSPQGDPQQEIIQTKNSFAPYQPLYYSHFYNYQFKNDSEDKGPYNFFSRTKQWVTSIYIPSYIAASTENYENIHSIKIKYFSDEGILFSTVTVFSRDPDAGTCDPNTDLNDQESACLAEGSCSNPTYTTEATCEGAGTCGWKTPTTEDPFIVFVGDEPGCLSAPDTCGITQATHGSYGPPDNGATYPDQQTCEDAGSCYNDGGFLISADMTASACYDMSVDNNWIDHDYVWDHHYEFTSENLTWTASNTWTPATGAVSYLNGCSKDTNPWTLERPTYDHKWCITKDQTETYDVMHVIAAGGEGAWGWAGLVIDFYPVNTINHIYKDTESTKPNQIGLKAGNAMYYLTKFGRLELLGIPQIFYEPIYCNSNKSKLVDGIFTMDPNRTDFENESFYYDPGVNGPASLGQIYDSSLSGEDISNNAVFNVTQIGKVVFQDKIDLPKIFSGHKFLCCQKLGAVTTAAANCCSGFSVTSSQGQICKLPPRTNLNVYFNRFVSGEGVGDDQPGGGFKDEDFIPETGEIKLTRSAYDKLTALGAAHCSSGYIIKGATFGSFYGEPNNGYYVQSGSADEGSKIFSIIDSMKDEDEEGNGAVAFQEGYRWSHHYYCDYERQ